MDGPVGSVWRAQQGGGGAFSRAGALLGAAGQTTGAGASPGHADPLQVFDPQRADYAAVARSRYAISRWAGTSRTR
jgi:hypothetical protein